MSKEEVLKQIEKKIGSIKSEVIEMLQMDEECQEVSLSEVFSELELSCSFKVRYIVEEPHKIVKGWVIPIRGSVSVETV